MKLNRLFFAFATLIGVLAAPFEATAQIPGFTKTMQPPRTFAVVRPPIQKELKLTDEQNKKIKVLFAETVSTDENGRTRIQISNFDDIEGIDKGVKAILTKEQNQRLFELWLQEQGGLALAEDEVADLLTLTKEQRSRVDASVDGFVSKMHEAMSSGAVDMQKQFKEYRKTMDKELLDLLDEKQRAKLKELCGKPFNFEGTVREDKIG